jgi:hypothetical protein
MIEGARMLRHVPQSIRLVIEYEGSRLRLVPRQSVAMVAPAPQRLRARPDERGYWVELHDERRQPLYRQTLHDPIKESLEVPAADGETLLRHPREKVVGRFSVVVPYLSAARAVSIVGPTAEPDASGGHAREIARFELGDKFGGE